MKNSKLKIDIGKKDFYLLKKKVSLNLVYWNSFLMRTDLIWPVTNKILSKLHFGPPLIIKVSLWAILANIFTLD